jgi:hypothetical protein
MIHCQEMRRAQENLTSPRCFVRLEVSGSGSPPPWRD